MQMKTMDLFTVTVQLPMIAFIASPNLLFAGLRNSSRIGAALQSAGFHFHCGVLASRRQGESGAPFASTTGLPTGLSFASLVILDVRMTEELGREQIPGKTDVLSQASS
jgi:hypothetical protein